MRRLLTIATLIVLPFGLLVAWSLTGTRRLTLDEKETIRGGASEVCYKDGTRLCIDEQPCPDILPLDQHCPATGTYDALQSFDAVVQQSFDTGPGAPGEPWYKSKEDGLAAQCYNKHVCVSQVQNGFRFCDKGEFISLWPPANMGPYWSWTTGNVCEEEQAD